MKKFILLSVVTFLFCNLSFADSKVIHYKSGSYKVTTGNRSNTYDKYGKKKTSTVKDFSGKTVTKKYDKKGTTSKTTVKEPNGTTKVYDKNGKLIKKKQVINY